MSYIDITYLQGKTLQSITGLEEGSDLVTFVTSDGQTIQMLHHQDCCESVSVNEMVGDTQDLIGHVIEVAEERTSDGPDDWGTSTWTFYTLRTIKGTVDIRWLGSSNGYYAEGVSLQLV